jgi:hypothetical protein
VSAKARPPWKKRPFLRLPVATLRGDSHGAAPPRNEEARHARKRRFHERLPPALVRDLDHPAAEPLDRAGAIIGVPQRPGIGLEVDRAMLERYAVTTGETKR